MYENDAEKMNNRVDGLIVGVIYVLLTTRLPPISTQSKSSAASDVYNRLIQRHSLPTSSVATRFLVGDLSFIHISEPTRLRRITYAVFCSKIKNM